MDPSLKERLDKMTAEEKQNRFRELRESLGLQNPPPLGTVPTPAHSSEEFEEYFALEKALGYRS